MTDAVDPSSRRRSSFAHASEAEFARILDYYRVRWEYEPVVFPILWDLEGNVLESFAPDFYLPDMDLFVEMTTLQQRLVRKKNRKVRRLHELYPGIAIKLFYARDFRALMLKYGRVALVDELSGTIGQVPSRHASGSVAALAAANPVLAALAPDLPDALPSGLATESPAPGPDLPPGGEDAMPIRRHDAAPLPDNLQSRQRRRASRAARRRAARAAATNTPAT